MSLNSDYQKLEPGNVVRLFDVDGTAFGVSDVLRFHATTLPTLPMKLPLLVEMKISYRRNQSGGRGRNIKPGPAQIEGIETATDGTSAQPTLSVANLDSSITALCLTYDDLLQANGHDS